MTVVFQGEGVDKSIERYRELFFDDVRVPVANLLGGVEGKGFYHLMSELPYERLMLGIGAMAIIERALEITVTYTKERKAFGKALLEMQNTRFVLANLKAQAVMARAFVDECIQRMVDGELDTVTASIVKLNLSELECQVMDKCLQLFGGLLYL